MSLDGRLAEGGSAEGDGDAVVGDARSPPAHAVAKTANAIRTRSDWNARRVRPMRAVSQATAEIMSAELVATGLTNRAVAAALFMSPKIVEANLSRVYAKLEIGSRAELERRWWNGAAGTRMAGPKQLGRVAEP